MMTARDRAEMEHEVRHIAAMIFALSKGTGVVLDLPGDVPGTAAFKAAEAFVELGEKRQLAADAAVEAVHGAARSAGGAAL
jgi:hypothetical protein